MGVGANIGYLKARERKNVYPYTSCWTVSSQQAPLQFDRYNFYKMETVVMATE